MNNAILLLLSTLFAVGAVELFLRHQSLVTLDYPPATIDPNARISYLYHHRMLETADVQRVTVGQGCGSQAPVRLLFLGDSWMEPMDGIPKGTADRLVETFGDRLCLDVENGGTTSFAPSLMLIKAEMVLRDTGADLVIANVDETDIMDEYLRYRFTTLRDHDGHIERVVPNIVDLAMRYERATLREQPVYVLRLIEQIYYEEVFLDRLRNEIYGFPEPYSSYEHIMSPQLSPDPWTTHKEALDYFRSVLREMLERLVKLVGNDRLVITRHPHMLHLTINGEAPKYSHVLSSLLDEETKRLGVRFYDAENDVEKIYDGRVAQYSRWPDDPFSHLTMEGFRRYGYAIGEQVEPTVAQILKDRDPSIAPQGQQKGP